MNNGGRVHTDPYQEAQAAEPAQLLIRERIELENE